jgi:hypothetical protein
MSHEGVTEEVTPPSLDEIHTLLKSRRRRYVLYCLHRYANPLTMLDLADRVTDLECETATEERLEKRLRVHLSLYHTHIPTLAAADVVVYSPDENMVELGPTAAKLRPHLERAVESDLNAVERQTR